MKKRIELKSHRENSFFIRKTFTVSSLGTRFCTPSRACVLARLRGPRIVKFPSVCAKHHFATVSCSHSSLQIIRHGVRGSKNVPEHAAAVSLSFFPDKKADFFKEHEIHLSTINTDATINQKVTDAALYATISFCYYGNSAFGHIREKSPSKR